MSNKYKILTIIGARPQFIKAAMLSHAIAKQEDIEEVLIHTGQHYDENMSAIFFDELDIPRPKYKLDINNLSHGAMTGQMLIGLEEVIRQENPSSVLVYGDTDSTLAGALAAAKLNIKVIHVEAGLRSHNKKMPEEINRVLTDHVSEILFCPTQQSVDNLAKENITQNVHLVGDIMHDLLHYAKGRTNNNLSLLDHYNLKAEQYIVLTLHRAENTNDLDRLNSLLEYVKKYASDNNLDVIFPIHPRTKNICSQHQISLDGLSIIEPLGYFDLQGLVSNSAYVFTDSGGLQKEAYYHRKPCVTLRDETEWTETIDCGWNRLWLYNSYKPRKDIIEYDVKDSVAEVILDQLRVNLNSH